MNAYYLIGEHLAHSCSPELHRGFGRYDYKLQELRPEELGPFLEARSFSGLNVTIPYKQAVIPYLDVLDEQAAAVGAVNTVVNRNGKLWGYNTDFGGMRDAIRQLLPHGPAALCRQKVLILGSGGTSKTALAVCNALGAGKVQRVSRTGKDGACTYLEAVAQHRDAAWILNCTPAGMYPNLEESPLSLAASLICHSERSEESVPFPQLQGVFDCVYNPLRTRLVLAAQKRGLPAGGGLYMLVKQAALACERFTGAPVAEAQIQQLYAKLHRDRENLVLIGMPGAGKTTVGRLLAAKSRKSFVDLDEAIVRRAGKSIPAIFAEDGEAVFRDLESDLIRALSTKGGQVIATGGGAVLREENVLRLKQNGRLIFLDRPLAALRPTADRPLGDTAEKLQQLYETRFPVYHRAADLVIDASPRPEELAARLATL
ncbi:MAG: shikimate dehydrogenase [Oscillospiraceae bacterium]|nr:shikimate dehydrogenase [Oscillospiraceae bacterium]